MNDNDKIVEALQDKEWRMNNLYKIKAKTRETITFQANEIQQLFYKNRVNRDVILKARQQTISTGVIIDFLDDVLWENNVIARTIADNQETLPKLFDKAKFAYYNLPKFVQELVPATNSTKYEMKFKNRGSEYAVCLKTHGETVSHLHFSEVAFIDANEVTERVDESTEAVPFNTKTTKIVFESIANGAGNYFHDLCNSAMNGESEYKFHFYRWFDLKEYQIPLEEGEDKIIIQSLAHDEKKLIEDHTLSLEQIKWRRTKVRSFRRATYEENLEIFKVKYPENEIECFLASGNSVFNQKVIAMYKNQNMLLEPIMQYMILKNGKLIEDPEGDFHIYQMPIQDREYVISCDVARGTKKGDYSVAYVLDRQTGQAVAKYKIHLPATLFGVHSAIIGWFYNTGILAIEANFKDSALQKAVDMKYPKLYYMGMEDGRPFRDFGWETNQRSKQAIIEQFRYDFETMMFSGLPKSLLNEMNTYIENDNHKMGADARKGSSGNTNRDDEVMGFAIGNYLCTKFPVVNRVKKKSSQILQYGQQAMYNKSTEKKKHKGATRAIRNYYG